MTREEYFDKTVAEGIPHWFLAAATVTFIYFFVEPATLSPSLHNDVLLVRFILFSGTGIGYLWFKSNPLSPRWGHPVFLALVGWILLWTSARNFVAMTPNFTFFIQVILMGIGMVGLRRNYALVAAVLTIGVWLTTLHSLQKPPEIEDSFLVLGAILVGFHCLQERRRVIGEQLNKKVREWEKREQLNQALQEAQMARTTLDLQLERYSDELSNSLVDLMNTNEQREALHRELLHSNRIQAVGRLAGGLAHRLNNQLMVLQGNLDMLKDTVNRPETAELLEEMVATAERGARLTEQLVPLTGSQFLTPRDIPVSTLLGELKNSCKFMKSRLEIIDKTEDSAVHVDSSAWFQIMTNLIRNADQANPEGGTVTVAAEPDGEEVVFSVEDDGGGIPRALRDRMFEPFFSTKLGSGGTGLGLSIVLGLVEQMKGHLSCSNTAERGARFEVSFQCRSRRQTPSDLPAAAPKRSVFCGKALVVEDDNNVRNVLSRQLRALGVDTETSPNGKDALARFPDFPFDVLITDVVMPEIDGPTLVKEIRRKNQNIQVIFTSGYSDSRLRQAGIDPLDYRWLGKPYDRNRLKEALEGILLPYS